jgi:cell fate regulator YaaT (PSP1 superfamily)
MAAARVAGYARPARPPRGAIGQALAESVKCGNGLEKIYPTTAVRFGYLRFIGEFTHAPDMKFTCGARVVMQTRRGIEMGEQVSLTCSGCTKSVTRDQMKQWVHSCGEDSFMFDAGRILREATAEDLAEYSHIQAGCRSKRMLCQQIAQQYKLPLKVVECEHLFGGERLLFYFMAEERVDFRNMVRDLTKEYRTRIEMRQVGARDEARLLADYETCGREVCCKVFLKTLRPITMRMAKLQKATLDPTQVSGRCGRLKCCLRYEHLGYEELDKKLPRNGVRIRTNHGDGVIINRQVLTQLVQIRKDDGIVVTVVAEDITEIGIAAPPRPVLPPDVRPERPGLRPRPKPAERTFLRSEAGPSTDDTQSPLKPERASQDRPPQEDRSRKDPERPASKPPPAAGTPPAEGIIRDSSPGQAAPRQAGADGQSGRRRVRRRRGKRGGSGRRPGGKPGGAGNAGPPQSDGGAS